MTRKNLVLGLCLFVALAVGAISAVFGQATYGNIIGTVTDPDGATTPGVQITIQNVGTGVSVAVETNDSGNYIATHLLPGTYMMTFLKQGFQTFVQKQVTVAVGTSTPIDAKLQLGTVSQQVTVGAAPPPLEADRAEVTSRLSSEMIENIPVLNRISRISSCFFPVTSRTTFNIP